MATLLVSQGVPMILGGDEFLRTQKGNNNAWCQDNAISWVDWSLEERNAGFLRFVRQMIALRMAHPALRRRTFFTGAGGGPPEILWHGVEPAQPDFSWASHSLAFALDGRSATARPDRSRHLRRDEQQRPDARVQDPGLALRSPWRRVVDTALASPEDILESEQGRRSRSVYSYTCSTR